MNNDLREDLRDEWGSYFDERDPEFNLGELLPIPTHCPVGAEESGSSILFPAKVTSELTMSIYSR